MYEKCKSMVIVEPGEGVTICNVRLPVEVAVSKPDSPPRQSAPSTEKRASVG